MTVRRLMIFEHLPEHASSQERVIAARADIEEAVAKIAKKLTDRASREHVLGWVDDPAGITFDVSGMRVTGQLRIERPD